VGKAFKKLSPSNPISHEPVFKLNGKLIHSAAPVKGFSLSFVHHISQREPQQFNGCVVAWEVPALPNPCPSA
jgi:hypothetical protein